MKSRFVLVASCLSFLTTGSCTSSNPAQGTDDLGGADMSVAADLSESTPPDFATQPPDLVPGCGFGQDFTTGACACDAKHTTLCNGNTYCCGAAQNCIPAPGPRGETRCSGPSAREAATLGFDAVRNNLILRTGGCLDTAQNAILCQDQWMLSQVTWDAQQPTTVITPRFGSTMAWLPSKQQLVLFGGQTTQNNAGTAVNDFYAWSGSDWTKLAPALSPSARAFTAMAYDPGRLALVLFGGVDKANASQSDTWEYNNTSGNWKLITPANNVPPAREGLGMVYDTNINKIVMHAGFVAGAYGRDTWTYDGNDWTKLTDNTTITLHGYFGMAFDPDRKVTVLYGGETTGGAAVDETWEFNGTAWTKKTPVATPGKRSKPAMAYDAVRKQMIVVGGNSGANLLKDVWAWDGTNWTQLY